jgi:hypothetical protein
MRKNTFFLSLNFTNKYNMLKIRLLQHDKNISKKITAKLFHIKNFVFLQVVYKVN